MALPVRLLLQILQLFVVLGLFVPPSAQASPLGSSDGESHWRSAQLERIALAHEQQGESRASRALDEPDRGRSTPEVGSGDALTCAHESATGLQGARCERLARVGREHVRLALSHLRVNGSANAAGARA